MRQDVANEVRDLPLGVRLKLERIGDGVRQYVMADRLNMSASVLSLIESGRRPVPQGFEDRYREALAKAKVAA